MLERTNYRDVHVKYCEQKIFWFNSFFIYIVHMKNFVEYHHYGPETANIFIELRMLF